MEFLICLWLLALLTRLDGADCCGLCAKVSTADPHAGKHRCRAQQDRS